MKRRSYRYEFAERQADTYDAIKSAVNAAFGKLRKAGYVAKQGFMCCGSCASYAIGEQIRKAAAKKGVEVAEDNYRAVYYCKQGAANFYTSGKLFVNWSGDAQAIADAFRAEGLGVVHSGSKFDRIEITGLIAKGAEDSDADKRFLIQAS